MLSPAVASLLRLNEWIYEQIRPGEFARDVPSIEGAGRAPAAVPRRAAPDAELPLGLEKGAALAAGELELVRAAGGAET